jgi:hypothetical protein
VTVNSPQITSKQPQIHHQKTTFNTPFFQKTQQKHYKPLHKKYRETKAGGRANPDGWPRLNLGAPSSSPLAGLCTPATFASLGLLFFLRRLAIGYRGAWGPLRVPFTCLMSRNTAAAWRIADTIEFNNSPFQANAYPVHTAKHIEGRQLRQCAQPTKKRIKSGIADALRGKTPPVWVRLPGIAMLFVLVRFIFQKMRTFMTENHDYQRFRPNEIARSFPETSETLLMDTYLTDEAAASARVFRVYRETPRRVPLCTFGEGYLLDGRRFEWRGVRSG